MRRTSELWELAEQEGIQVVWETLRPGRVGLYLPRYGSRPVIVLDPWLEHRERWLRAVLAHELGHHFTATQGWLSLAVDCPDLDRACEAAAQRWALEYLMPWSEFSRVAARCAGPSEVAEYFFVPESWVWERWNLGVSSIASGREQRG